MIKSKKSCQSNSSFIEQLNIIKIINNKRLMNLMVSIVYKYNIKYKI